MFLKLKNIEVAGDKYMTRLVIGDRLMFNVFHRGDVDPDPHDHPWDFWTFPLTTYVEHVHGVGFNVVKSFRLHYRPATYTHKVIGKFGRDWKHSPSIVPGKIITIVWVSKRKRDWGFLKHRDGKWCWVYWKDYVFGSGKNDPC